MGASWYMAVYYMAKNKGILVNVAQHLLCDIRYEGGEGGVNSCSFVLGTISLQKPAPQISKTPQGTIPPKNCRKFLEISP